MKKSEISPSVPGLRPASPQRTDSKFGRVAGDVVLFAVVVSGLIIFLWHNGFVGPSGIQPFPY